MISLVTIIAQIILRDYKEIRWGMILCSLLFLCLFIVFVISVCLLNWNVAILSLILLLLSILLEIKYLPILWKTKKLKRDH
jgi:hypothetical protein